MEHNFMPGDKVQHFKRTILNKEELSTNRYLYQIVGVATDSETREQVMVYQALYGDFGLFVRPLEMFLSEVDHEKYPNVTQKFRFEKLKND